MRLCEKLALRHLAAELRALDQDGGIFRRLRAKAEVLCEFESGMPAPEPLVKDMGTTKIKFEFGNTCHGIRHDAVEAYNDALRVANQLERLADEEEGA